MEIRELSRGDVVLAIKNLDPYGANVRKGTVGIVFEETNAYGDNGGPMVRWTNMGACNIYQGDVIQIDYNSPKIDLTDEETGEVYGTL